MRRIKFVKIALLYFLLSQLILVTAQEGGSEDAINPSNSSREGRWSIFSRAAEHLCAAKCREIGNKPFGHLRGAKCHCLCPINAEEWDLCNASGNRSGKYCFPFCQNIGYFKGGLCLNRNCMCTCGLLQPYDSEIIYATPASA